MEPVAAEKETVTEDLSPKKGVEEQPETSKSSEQTEMTLEQQSKMGRRQRPRVEICSHAFLNEPKRTYLPSGLDGLQSTDVTKDLRDIQSCMPMVPLPPKYVNQAHGQDHGYDMHASRGSSKRRNNYIDEPAEEPTLNPLINGRKPDEAAAIRRQICNSELDREQVEVTSCSLQRHIEAALLVLQFQKTEYVGGMLALQKLLLEEHSDLLKERRRVFAATTLVLAKMGLGGGGSKRKSEDMDKEQNKSAKVSEANKLSVDTSSTPLSLDQAWKTLCQENDVLGNTPNGDNASDSVSNGRDTPSSDVGVGGRARRKNAGTNSYIPSNDSTGGSESGNHGGNGGARSQPQCVFTSCVGGHPFLKSLLLSPLSEVPDRSLATNLSNQHTDWKDMTSDALKAAEDNRLKRYRIEADILQLKAALKQVKDCAKELNKQKNDAVEQARTYKTCEEKMIMQLQDFKAKCYAKSKDSQEIEDKKTSGRKGKGRGTKAK